MPDGPTGAFARSACGSRSARVIYAAVVALLAASAFVTSYLPARRATRVDPLEALRSD